MCLVIHLWYSMLRLYYHVLTHSYRSFGEMRTKRWWNNGRSSQTGNGYSGTLWSAKSLLYITSIGNLEAGGRVGALQHKIIRNKAICSALSIEQHRITIKTCLLVFQSIGGGGRGESQSNRIQEDNNLAYNLVYSFNEYLLSSHHI